MANDDSSIFQEIDEALRVENMEKFLRRHGKAIIAGCFGIVFMTAVSVLWKSHQREADMKYTGIVMQAQALADAGKYGDAAQKFAEAEGGRGGIVAIARLKHAQMLARTGQNDKALALYDAIAASGRGTDEAIKDLAAIDASIIANNKKLPQKDGSALQAASGKDRPFAPIAHELSALRMQESGKNKEAHDILAGMIDDPYLPLSERERIMELLDLTHGDKK